MSAPMSNVYGNMTANRVRGEEGRSRTDSPGWTWMVLDGPGWGWVDLGGPGWTSMDLGGSGWIWVDLGGPGWTWVDLDGPGWTWMDLDGPGWAWMEMDLGRSWMELDGLDGGIKTGSVVVWGVGRSGWVCKRTAKTASDAQMLGILQPGKTVQQYPKLLV
jgi:hypothetical protein